MTPIPDWSRALGPTLFEGCIRSAPADFVVTELLSFEFSGDGEHDMLWIEKTGANTQWVAERLAAHAGVPVRDVGYSGLKDRHAVTTQWFSVRRATGEGYDWETFSAEGVRVLRTERNRRKLRRSAHSGNNFRIAIRSDEVITHRDAIDDRLATIAAGGVPNYFGPQRFGHGGGNVDLGRAVLDGRRVSRNKRSIGISALRSYEFNVALDERVRAGTWNTVLPGDVANLDGTGSVFAVDEVTPELELRCAEMDIHPSGTLPGFEAIGVEAGQRPLRMRVQDLRWDIEEDALWFEFSLRRGSYATAVLREFVRTDQAGATRR